MAKKRPRIKTLRPRLQELQPRLAVAKGQSWTSEGRGSRHERGYGSAWDKLRIQILERDHGICQPCAKAGLLHEGNEVDHVVGKAQWKREHGSLEGVDDPANLQCICRDAHREKTARESLEARGYA